MLHFRTFHPTKPQFTFHTVPSHRHQRYDKISQPLTRASSSGDSDARPAGGPSLSEAYATLGLNSENASYEDVLNAKNKLLENNEGNREKMLQIEVAYDTIFSSQLTRRLSGDLPVSNKVRFADVKRTRSKPQKPSIKLPSTGGNMGVSVRQMADDDALLLTGLYGGLAAWTLAQGLLEPSPAVAVRDVPGLQLALGVAAAVYTLREKKKVGLGKAVGISVAGLILGSLVGSGVESWLRVDLIPIGSLSSPGIVVGEFGLLGLFAAAFLLA